MVDKQQNYDLKLLQVGKPKTRRLMYMVSSHLDLESSYKSESPDLTAV